MSPNGSIEWRYIPILNYRLGTAVIFDIAIEADQAHETAMLAVTIPQRLDISDDSGATWDGLGIDVTDGYDLGSFTPGERKEYKLRYQTSEQIREETIGFQLGEGT